MKETLKSERDYYKEKLRDAIYCGDWCSMNKYATKIRYLTEMIGDVNLMKVNGYRTVANGACDTCSKSTYDVNPELYCRYLKCNVTSFHTCNHFDEG